MAINFLDNIQLNQNQLLGARIENVTSDPSSGAVGGDIIFNSTSNVLKYYNGTGWISLTADTQGMVSWTLGDGSATATISNGQEAKFASGTGITTSLNTRTITISNSQPFNGLTLSASSGNSSSISDEGTITIAAGVGITTTNNGSGQVTIAATGTGSMSNFTLSGDGGTNQTIEDGDTLNIAGGTNITTVVGATDKVTVNLDASPTLAGQLTVSGTGQSSFAGQVTIPATPSANTDAASKAYVDSAVTGGLNVKGGFNANTGAIATGGNLTSGGSRVAIAIGDYYVVTTAGNFFGQASTPLTPGDSVLVQTAAAAGASTINDFAVIQSDTDLATAAAVGIGNVNVNAENTNRGGLSLDYSLGTGTVGVDIDGQDAIAALAEMQFLVYDAGDTAVNGKLDIGSLATYVSANTGKQFVGTSSNATTHTFNHSLGSFNVIVQLYDTSSKETVYASVDRTSVDQVVATTASAASLTCLIDKIG
jgi:hypothetical protein